MNLVALGRIHSLSFALAKAGTDSEHGSRKASLFLLCGGGGTDTMLDHQQLRQPISFVEGKAIDPRPGTFLGTPLTLVH